MFELGGKFERIKVQFSFYFHFDHGLLIEGGGAKLIRHEPKRLGTADRTKKKLVRPSRTSGAAAYTSLVRLFNTQKKREK